MCSKAIIGYACISCKRPTNHGIIFVEESLPTHNLATLQCLSCDTGSFTVKYAKEEDYPSSNSQRVTNAEQNN